MKKYVIAVFVMATVLATTPAVSNAQAGPERAALTVTNIPDASGLVVSLAGADLVTPHKFETEAQATISNPGQPLDTDEMSETISAFPVGLSLWSDQTADVLQVGPVHNDQASSLSSSYLAESRIGGYFSHQISAKQNLSTSEWVEARSDFSYSFTAERNAVLTINVSRLPGAQGTTDVELWGEDGSAQFAIDVTSGQRTFALTAGVTYDFEVHVRLTAQQLGDQRVDSASLDWSIEADWTGGLDCQTAGGFWVC